MNTKKQKESLYYMIEPSNIMPAWIINSSQYLCKFAAQKRISVAQLPYPEMHGTIPAGTPVIVFGTTKKWTHNTIQCLRLSQLKPIVIGITLDNFHDNISCVTMNRSAFIEKAVYYFVSNHRKRLCLFGINSQISNDMIKAEQFLIIGKQMGLGLTHNDIFHAGEDSEHLEAAADAFFARSHLYDGLICSNDHLALYLLSRAEDYGLRIPEDLWISGYGNYLIGRCCMPSMTSASINTYALAEQALHLWRTLQNSPYISHIITSIECEIIPRESTSYQPVPDDFHSHMETISESYSRVFAGHTGQIHNLENCLCHCDEIDSKIFILLLNNHTLEQIASVLFLSIGAVKYRIKKLFQVLEVANRSEFKSLMKLYKISPENIQKNLFSKFTS